MSSLSINLLEHELQNLQIGKYSAENALAICEYIVNDDVDNFKLVMDERYIYKSKLYLLIPHIINADAENISLYILDKIINEYEYDNDHYNFNCSDQEFMDFVKYISKLLLDMKIKDYDILTSSFFMDWIDIDSIIETLSYLNTDCVDICYFIIELIYNSISGEDINDDDLKIVTELYDKYINYLTLDNHKIKEHIYTSFSCIDIINIFYQNSIEVESINDHHWSSWDMLMRINPNYDNILGVVMNNININGVTVSIPYIDNILLLVSDYNALIIKIIKFAAISDYPDLFDIYMPRLAEPIDNIIIKLILKYNWSYLLKYYEGRKFIVTEYNELYHITRIWKFDYDLELFKLFDLDNSDIKVLYNYFINILSRVVDTILNYNYIVDVFMMRLDDITNLIDMLLIVGENKLYYARTINSEVLIYLMSNYMDQLAKYNLVERICNGCKLSHVLIKWLYDNGYYIDTRGWSDKLIANDDLHMMVWLDETFNTNEWIQTYYDKMILDQNSINDSSYIFLYKYMKSWNSNMDNRLCSPDCCTRNDNNTRTKYNLNDNWYKKNEYLTY